MSESGGGYGGGSTGGGGGGHGPPITALYATSIHEARASGDQARMRAVAQAAQQTLDQVDEIRAALADLQAAIRSGGGS